MQNLTNIKNEGKKTHFVEVRTKEHEMADFDYHPHDGNAWSCVYNITMCILLYEHTGVPLFQKCMFE